MADTKVDEPAVDAAEKIDTEQPSTSKAKQPKKPAAKKTEKAAKKSPAKSSSKADHPKYNLMVREALVALKERGGVSRQAILRYIMAHYSLPYDAKAINQHLGMTLRAGVKNGSLKQSKGSGACGSFKLGEAKPTKSKKSKSETKKAAPAAPKKAAKKPEKKKTSRSGKAGKTAKSKSSPKKAKSSKKVSVKKPGKPKSMRKSGKATTA